MNSLACVLMELGVRGVEIARVPNEDGCIRFRPKAQPTELVIDILRFERQLCALLAQESVSDGEVDVFIERLGIAAELGMDTHPGSSAWCLAVAEAYGAINDIGKLISPSSVARTMSRPFGRLKTVGVIAKGCRFDGEPDWTMVWPSLMREGADHDKR